MSEFSHGPTPPEFVVTKPLPEVSVPSAELMMSIKTPQELTNERIQRLEDLAKDFTLDQTPSAIRVHEFLQHENDFSRKPWRKYLKNPEDWILYHQLNPNWQGLNQKQIIDENEGYAFFGAFLSWTKEKYGDSYKNTVRLIFPNEKKEWSDLKTTELWQEKLTEEKQTPEWNHSDKKIRKNYKKNFKQQFNNWIQKTTKDPVEKEKIYTQLFPIENEYTEFDSFEEFKEEYKKNPKWKNITLAKITLPENKVFLSFYNHLRKFSMETFSHLPKEEQVVAATNLRNQIIEPIYKFKDKSKEWTKFTTVEEWLSEKEKLGWTNLNREEIAKQGGYLFTKGYSKFIMEKSKDIPPHKQKRFLNKMRVTLYGKTLGEYSHLDSEKEFREEYDKHPEWKNLNTNEICQIGGESFYRELNKWADEEVFYLDEKNKKSTKKLIVEKFFPKQHKDWSNLDSTKKMLEYFHQQTNWQGKTVGEVIKDGGKNFIATLNIRINDETKNIPEKNRKYSQNKIRRQFFLDDNDFSHLETKEEFENEFINHPEWINKGFSEFLKTKGGEAFYRAFNKLKKEIIKDIPESERKKKDDELKFSKVFSQIQKNINGLEADGKLPEKTEEKDKNIKKEDNIVTKEEKTKIENSPEINPIIIPSNPIDFSQKDNWLVNGFEIRTVDTTSENNQEKNGNNGNGSSKLPFKQELTPSQIIRLMSGKGDWDAKFYAEHIGQLATYVVHRGEIGYLLNLFSQNHQEFPKIIADLGSGPSTAYSAYEELGQTIENFGYQKPLVIDIDKNTEMMGYGSNPNKKISDISQKIDLDDQEVDMVQSTFVFHYLKPQEILNALTESNRITKTGGYLSLVCRQPFSQSFLSGVEQLGYELITQHGEILSPNEQMSEAISKEFDTDIAKRFQNRFKNSFILVARKIENTNNLPSSENFTFDQVKKTIRERKPILDLKNYNIETSPLTENIERITDSIVYQLHQLEVSPLRQEGGLIPGGNEIKSSYDIFNGNLNLIQSLYDKTYNKIKNQFNTLTPEQIDQFNQLKEQLRTAREYKRDFYQRHIR